MKRRIVLTLLMTLLLLPMVVQACDSARSDKQAITVNPSTAVDRVSVAPPAFLAGIFRCTNCHNEMKPDLKHRKLQDEHPAVVLHHTVGSSGAWSLTNRRAGAACGW